MTFRIDSLLISNLNEPINAFHLRQSLKQKILWKNHGLFKMISLLLTFALIYCELHVDAWQLHVKNSASLNTHFNKYFRILINM